MTTLWDELPASATSGGALDGLRPLLDSVTTPAESTVTDPDGSVWRTWTSTVGDSSPLAVDLTTGATSRDPGGISSLGSGATGGALELPTSAQVSLGLRLDAPGGSPDGSVRIDLLVDTATVQVPQLRGAQLDGRGQLIADPAHPAVRFHLPALKIRIQRLRDADVTVDLLSTSTGSGTPTDKHYEFVRMEPPYALIGPGDVVGFAYRSAVLDLSGTADPAGGVPAAPATALAEPGAWQGLYLPEVRLFVAPSGLDGIAVSAGVRDLWIGFGVHEGVTGEFNAEIVNRGAAPEVHLRAQTPTGEWIGIDDAATTAQLPETVTLYVTPGSSLAPYTIEIEVDGTTHTSDRVDLTVPASGSSTVEVTVSSRAGGSGTAPRTTTRQLTVSRRSATPGAPAGGGDGEVRPTTTSSVGYEVVVLSRTATHATVGLRPAVDDGTVVWSWSGPSSGTAPAGATAQVPVAAGSPVDVTARVTRTPATPTTVDAYFGFGRPQESEFPGTPAQRWELTPGHLTAEAWASRTSAGSALPWTSPDGLARLDALPDGATWTVEAWASYEATTAARDSGHSARNQTLSERRRDALVALLRSRGMTATPGTAHGDGPAQASSDPLATHWWHARATATLTQDVTVTGRLTRVTTPPPPREVDPAPTPAPTPDCFRLIGVTVELVRSTFVRAEVYGEFDIDTAVEQRLRANGATPPPARSNPSDGITRFLVRLRVAEDRSSWDVTAELRAVRDDVDGLWQRISDGTDGGINVLGAVAVFAPLMATTTPPSPTAGELVPMALIGGTAVALGAAGVVRTRKITLHGGQFMITDGLVDPASGTGPRETQVSLLLDVETAFTFDVGILKVDPDKPLTTRYKAVGVRSSWTEEPQPDGTVEYVPLPVFDPSQGYSLDIPMGALTGPEGLQDLLRVLGARISQDNPLYLEVEVGLGVDLGIVTVDSARVRIRLDEAEFPQLTALRASLEVPGTLHGSGQVQILENGFAGAFDVTLSPINLRIAASLAVAQEDGVTGVLIGAEVQFPAPIVLGNSGLAIFGFLGGVGINYARKERTDVRVPALAWLEEQLPRPTTVMNPLGWKFQPGAYAVAGGILLGTAEGGFLVHLKGILLIEVPGPRILLAMKADVLSLPPLLNSTQSASFLAVLDLDFGRGTITIGIVAQYSIEKLLEVRVPVTAFFDTNDVDEWFIELGSYDEPVTVAILDVFEGTGYLMIHGNGQNVSIPTLPVVTQGLTVATGFHLRAVLMGSKAVGLYLEVAAGFDAVMSFSPFALGGFIYVKGELRLWVIGISASAELTVLVGPQLVDGGTRVEDRTYIHGEVCGEVDLFFFSVKGCVSLTIGDNNPAPLDPPDLVTGVTLVSRSPALVEGSAVDRPVDGVLGNAVEVGETGDLPSVPLDAIPVISFATAPTVAPGDVILGGTAAGPTGALPDPWVKKGEHWWRFRLTSVELVGDAEPDLQPEPSAGGKTPATWWTRELAPDPQIGPALALLSWLPEPTPRAIELGEQLTRTVERHWGSICTPVARPAPVLWTFDEQPVGPSPTGWRLDGIPWPDDPGTTRSQPVETRATVTETWRTGDALADLLQGVQPAVVVGDVVPCLGRKQDHERNHRLGAADTAFTWLPLSGPGAQDVADLMADQGSGLMDADAIWAEAAGTTSGDPWKDLEAGATPCQGRLLRAPRGDDESPAKGTDDYENTYLDTTWNETGHQPSELTDAVVVRVDAGVREVEVLLLMDVERIRPVLLFQDAKGTVLHTRPVDPSDMLGGGTTLPSRWTDTTRPWADPVYRATALAQRIMAAQPGLVAALVRTEMPADVVQVQIGYDRGEAHDAEQNRGGLRPWWLVAFTATTGTEYHRHSWDTTTVSEAKDTLADAVTQDPDDHALLVPGRTYTVRVSWQSQSVKQDAKPVGVADSYGAVRTQEFRFRADGADKAPVRLDPWLLTTTPGEGEVGFLTGDPLRIALATQKVTELFDAYGEELRVVVRSASGRHPEPPTGGGPGAAVTLPLKPLLGGVLEPADGLTIMTPWQEAVTALLEELPCTTGSGSETHHSVITLAYPLEPVTDYLLDVLAVTKGAPANASPERGNARRVLRRGFTTSRYAEVADLARLTRLAEPRHAFVRAEAPLHGLADAPSGAALDDAFAAAGLPAPEVPRYPLVTVLWALASGATVPHPTAVVVESNEAMWRSRPVPTKVTGPADASDPTHQWWAARERDWLWPDPSTWSPSAGDPGPAPVTRVVRGPGGTRAVVLLGAGARGTELRLDLVQGGDDLAGTTTTRTLAVQVLLARAPWEVED